MAKRMVSPSTLLHYEQALKQEAKEEEEYKEACRVLFFPGTGHPPPGRR